MDIFTALADLVHPDLYDAHPDKARTLCEQYEKDLVATGHVTRADILATVEKIEKELTPAD